MILKLIFKFMSGNLDKIHKIYALYKQGVGGEKRNAEALLKNLLKKSNLTLKDYETRYHFNEAKYHSKKNNFCFYLLCLICKITYHFFITICETIYHFFIMMCEILLVLTASYLLLIYLQKKLLISNTLLFCLSQ
jgi:hypothetical protein